jgi:hypothetical protein
LVLHHLHYWCSLLKKIVLFWICMMMLLTASSRSMSSFLPAVDGLVYVISSTFVIRKHKPQIRRLEVTEVVGTETLSQLFHNV